MKRINFKYTLKIYELKRNVLKIFEIQYYNLKRNNFLIKIFFLIL